MIARFPSDAVATRPAVIAARDARPLHSKASLFKGVFGGAGENYLAMGQRTTPARSRTG